MQFFESLSAFYTDQGVLRHFFNGLLNNTEGDLHGQSDRFHEVSR